MSIVDKIKLLERLEYNLTLVAVDSLVYVRIDSIRRRLDEDLRTYLGLN